GGGRGGVGLAGGWLAVLVAPDCDVLGAVVGGERVAAQREHGGEEREQARDDLLRRLAEPRAADALEHDQRAERRDEHAPALEGQRRPRPAPLEAGEGSEPRTGGARGPRGRGLC